jgi:hypothetical protein
VSVLNIGPLTYVDTLVSPWASNSLLHFPLATIAVSSTLVINKVRKMKRSTTAVANDRNDSMY